jgi:hypothetical protein
VTGDGSGLDDRPAKKLARGPVCAPDCPGAGLLKASLT